MFQTKTVIHKHRLSHKSYNYAELWKYISCIDLEKDYVAGVTSVDR